VLSFLRRRADGTGNLLVVLNLTPVPREGYRVGLPSGGRWREVLNTDAASYGGSNTGNLGGVDADKIAAHGLSHSASFHLPPLSVCVFEAP
jgi:1,4-alpha-glucan branching enzyme